MKSAWLLSAALFVMASGCGPVDPQVDGPQLETRTSELVSKATTCTFCNPTGYLVCQNADGTSCSAPGTNRRCIVAPVCYCEWGICSCGTDGLWHCTY